MNLGYYATRLAPWYGLGSQTDIPHWLQRVGLSKMVRGFVPLRGLQ